MKTLRQYLHEVIFEADTTAGKWFDVLLIASIIISVMLVLLDSVESIRAVHGRWLYLGEWFFTGLHTFNKVPVNPALTFVNGHRFRFTLFARRPFDVQVFFAWTVVG